MVSCCLWRAAQTAFTPPRHAIDTFCTQGSNRAALHSSVQRRSDRDNSWIRCTHHRRPISLAFAELEECAWAALCVSGCGPARLASTSYSTCLACCAIGGHCRHAWCWRLHRMVGHPREWGRAGSFGDDLFEIGLTLLSQCRRDDASAKTPIKFRRLLGSFHLIITSKRVCKVTHSHQRWV